MKYFSLIILVLLMNWTWNFVEDGALVSQRAHLEIQQDLKTFLFSKVRELLPDVKQLEFHHFSTETRDPETIEARFTYSFLEQDATVTLSGRGELKKSIENQAEWDLVAIDIDKQESIEFAEDLLIRPSTEP